MAKYFLSHLNTVNIRKSRLEFCKNLVIKPRQDGHQLAHTIPTTYKNIFEIISPWLNDQLLDFSPCFIKPSLNGTKSSAIDIAMRSYVGKCQTLKHILMMKECNWYQCQKKNCKLKKCKRCVSVFYCSKLCQKKDWKTQHKFCCQKFKRRNMQLILKRAHCHN